MEKKNNESTMSLALEADTLRRKYVAPKDKHRHKYQWQAFLWMLPAFIFLGIFCYYPPVKALIDSFFNTGSDGVTSFVGFANYGTMFSDQMFWICVKNTFVFTIVGLVLGNAMTILLAELLYNLKSKKLSGFFRILFIIPILVPSIVIILIWKYVVFGSDGFINQMIVSMGGTKQTFYWDTTNSFMVKFAIIMTNFPWVAGTSFLIYLAGLQNIPSSVIEASKLDNCNSFKRIVKVDLPLLAPQLKYFLIMGIIGGIQNFNLQLIIIQTEHEYSNVLGLYLYNHAMGIGYNSTQYEYASAVGMFIFAVTLILTLISNISSRKKRA